MDTHTLELLEFDKIRQIVASFAASSLGKEAAQRLEPNTEIGAIRDQQKLTTEMTETLGAGLSPPLGGVHDIRTHVKRAAIGAMLAPDELAETAEVLRASGRVKDWLERNGTQFPRLGALQTGLGEFSSVASAIEACLDTRGRVLDTASRKLSAVRGQIGQVQEQIQGTLRQMLRTPELKRILRYPNFTMVGHHYVLPIAREHRGEIAGSVHRTSASNETVYVEPQAIGEHSAQLAFLRAREQKEVRRILRWLSAQVSQVAESVLSSLETLAEVDLLYAKARYSREGRMSPPELNADGRLSLRHGRHPLLEHLFRSEPGAAEGPEARSVVPIDVHLGLGFNILVVTGPNTGGKTVALKTVGLLAVMAQSGLHVPANEGSQLPVFDQVLADIGDEQSLEQSLSTFSSHVRRISSIVSLATEHSLVLLDELGAGTDPAEGAALGRAILDELDSIGCRAIVTTHIGDLKTYALSNPRAENAAVAFDLETLRPLYKLQIGGIGQSNALEIAKRLALPGHLVERARGYLEQNKGRVEPELTELQALRQGAEDARQAALAAQNEAERTRDALNQKLLDLQRQSETDARVDAARERLRPGDRVVVPRLGYDRPGRIVRIDAKRRMAVVSIGQVQWDVSLGELIPQVLPAGTEPGRRKGSFEGLDRASEAGEA